MKKIELKGNEVKLHSDLVDALKKVKECIKNKTSFNGDNHRRYKLQCDMDEIASKLYFSLKKRGFELKHSKDILENCGMKPGEKNFYFVIQPVEELIAFINYMDANNDAGDCTMNEKFDLKIYSRNSGYDIDLFLTRTENGWNLESENAFNDGECDKKGCSKFFDALNHESISYPYNVESFLEWLWCEAYKGLGKKDVQEALDDITNWISLCEKNVPRGIFKGLI